VVKRPRSHQLETKSRIAFEDAIPDRWHLQRPDSDYGIDGNVLIFDPETDELKFNFLLQLKSSEQSGDDFRVQISTERLREYSAYDSPVYIFGWNENSKTLYCINATEVEFDPSAASRQITLGSANKCLEAQINGIAKRQQKQLNAPLNVDKRYFSENHKSGQHQLY
jgi:Domain of unknown function (DUF4365)